VFQVEALGEPLSFGARPRLYFDEVIGAGKDGAQGNEEQVAKGVASSSGDARVWEAGESGQ